VGSFDVFIVLDRTVIAAGDGERRLALLTFLNASHLRILSFASRTVAL